MKKQWCIFCLSHLSPESYHFPMCTVIPSPTIYFQQNDYKSLCPQHLESRCITRILQLHLLYFEAWYYFYYHLQVTLLPFSSTLGAEDYSTSSVQCLFHLIQISLSFLNWPCKLAYKQQCLYFYIAVRDVC